MTVSRERYERDMSEALSRILTLEEELETLRTQNEIQGVSVVENLAEIANPLPNQVAIVTGESAIYVFTSTDGFLQLV